MIAGPYKVGHETIKVVSRDGSRARTVDVWYPADLSASGPHTRYSEAALPSLGFDSSLAFEHVPVSKDRPFPLVVYSHGSGALRFIAGFFTETLASHGFVVVSADHTGDTALDLLAGHPSTPAEEPATIASRVADVRLTVDAVLARSAATRDALSGSVDANRIGITGHSYGGLTAFAAVAGASPLPGVSIPRDRRFKVVVTMDATPELLTTADLANVHVPVMSIAGSALYPAAASFWYNTNADPFVEVRLDRAAHDTFTDICAYGKLVPAYPNAPKIVAAYITALAKESCTPPNMPAGRVHDLTNRFAIAFLERYLAGDKRYDHYLTQIPADGHSDVHVTHPTPITSQLPSETPMP